MARSVWPIRIGNLARIPVALSFGNAPYVGDFAQDQYLVVHQSEADPEIFVPSGTDVGFVVWGHFGNNTLAPLLPNASPPSMEIGLARGNTALGFSAFLSAESSLYKVDQVGTSFCFIYRYSSYDPLTPLRVIARLRANFATRTEWSGEWSIENLAIIGFDLGSQFDGSVHNDAVFLGGTVIPGSATQLASFAIPAGDWLAWLSCEMHPGQGGATINFRTDAGTQLGRFSALAAGTIGNTYNREHVARIAPFANGSPGAVQVFGAGGITNPSRIYRASMLLLPVAQFSSQFFEVSAGTTGLFPFSQPTFFGRPSSGGGATRIQFVRSGPTAGDLPEILVLADLSSAAPGTHRASVLHDSVGITGAGSASERIYCLEDHPSYGSGLSLLHELDQEFTVRGWQSPTLVTATNAAATHAVAVVMATDQSIVGTPSGAVAGPKISLGVGTEGPSLLDLEPLPITPRDAQPTDLLPVEGGLIEPETGHARTWPLFLVARRRVQLSFGPLAEPEVRALVDFIARQGRTAWRTAIVGSPTERAFAHLGGRIQINQIGFHRGRASELGAAAGDRRAYDVSLPAVELVFLG